jgi:hypothetical protein
MKGAFHMNQFAEGWRVTGLGLLSVFGVLLLLYFILGALVRVFPHKNDDSDTV